VLARDLRGLRRARQRGLGIASGLMHGGGERQRLRERERVPQLAGQRDPRAASIAGAFRVPSVPTDNAETAELAEAMVALRVQRVLR
jgi:hypothetical protein